MPFKLTNVHCQATLCKYNDKQSCWAYDVFIEVINPKLYDVLAVEEENTIPAFRCARYEKKNSN